MTGRSIIVGALSSLDPDDWSSDAAAVVLRRAVVSQRSGATLDCRTVTVSDRPRQRAAWRSAVAMSWPAGVDGVIVDHSLDDDHRAQGGVTDATSVIETTLFDDVALLCGLVASTIDPVAADTRRRMLAHLGVLSTPDGNNALARATELFGRPPTITDRLIIAQSASVDALDDPMERALAAGRTGAHEPLVNELDRLATWLNSVDPPLLSAAAQQQRIVELGAEVERLQSELVAAERQRVDSLERAAALVRSLDERHEADDLRAALAEG